MRNQSFEKKLYKFKQQQEAKKKRQKELSAEKQRKKRNEKKRKEYKQKKKDEERLTIGHNSTPKKKKVGRPKKRGPKKKRIRRKIIKNYKPQPVFDFKIVSCLNGKQNGHIGQYHNYGEAFIKFQELEYLNSQVIFPRKYINGNKMVPSKDEYLMLEKNRFGDKKDGMVRNEYGKYIVTKIINNDKWVVRDKMKKLVEETFWVYGFDPKTDRKTFSWIFDSLILQPSEEKYNIIRLLLFKNKVIFKYDDREMGIVLCKNKSDAIRLYNLISEKTTKHKQIFCLGSYDAISEKRKNLEKDLIDLTGWDKTKIQRNCN